MSRQYDTNLLSFGLMMKDLRGESRALDQYDDPLEQAAELVSEYGEGDIGERADEIYEDLVDQEAYPHDSDTLQDAFWIVHGLTVQDRGPDEIPELGSQAYDEFVQDVLDEAAALGPSDAEQRWGYQVRDVDLGAVEAVLRYVGDTESDLEPLQQDIQDIGDTIREHEGYEDWLYDTLDDLLGGEEPPTGPDTGGDGPAGPHAEATGIEELNLYGGSVPDELSDLLDDDATIAVEDGRLYIEGIPDSVDISGFDDIESLLEALEDADFGAEATGGDAAASNVDVDGTDTTPIGEGLAAIAEALSEDEDGDGDDDGDGEDGPDVRELDVDFDIVTTEYDPAGWWDRLGYRLGGEEQEAYVKVTGRDSAEYVNEYLTDLDQTFDAAVFTEYRTLGDDEDSGEKIPDFDSIKEELDVELDMDPDERKVFGNSIFMPMDFVGSRAAGNRVSLDPGESLWVEGWIDGDTRAAAAGSRYDEIEIPRLAGSGDSEGYYDTWKDLAVDGAKAARSTMHKIDTHPVIAGKNPGVWGENAPEEDGTPPTMAQRWARSKKDEPQQLRAAANFGMEHLLSGTAAGVLGHVIGQGTGN